MPAECAHNVEVPRDNQGWKAMSHGSHQRNWVLSVPQQNQVFELHEIPKVPTSVICMYGDLTARGIGNWYLGETVHDPGFFQREDIVPHVAAASAVAGLNLVGLGLMAAPHPYAKALGVAVIAIPDAAVYLLIYNMVD